jgi:hypothetical protein
MGSVRIGDFGQVMRKAILCTYPAITSGLAVIRPAISSYLSPSSEPKIAKHTVTARYAAGDGDAAAIETQWTTSAVLTIRPFSDGLRSPIKRYTPD